MQNLDWRELLSGEDERDRPRYLVLRDRLRRIVATLEPGTPIPSEHDLVAMAKLSRETVRRSVRELVAEGILATRKGVGTITVQRRVQTALNSVEGFTDAMRRAGHCPSTQVLSLTTEAPDELTRLELGLTSKDKVFVLERLRLIDAAPALVERAILPALRLPGFEQLSLEGSLYAILEETYCLGPVVGDETIFAVNADRKLSRHLDVPLGAALLASIRRSRSHHQVPVELTTRYVRPDLCAYFVDLNRGQLNARKPDDALMTLNTLN